MVLLDKKSRQDDLPLFEIHSTRSRTSDDRAAMIRNGLDDPDDREALECLFRATGGPSNAWERSTGWMSADTPLKGWHGVELRDGRVFSLHLINNSMSVISFTAGSTRCVRADGRLMYDPPGRLPAEFYNLPSLEELHLASSLGLSGPILPEVQNLTSLTNLVLKGNELDGPIPAALGMLVKLTRLNLSKNMFSGPIPEELGNLTEIQTLLLGGNALEGTVPLRVWKLPSIRALDVSSNLLTEFTDPTARRAPADVMLLLERAPLVLTNGNPWEFPPAAVAVKGLDSIRKYYETWEECQFLLEEVSALKVVFIGAAAAGKTSLSRSLRKGHGDRTPEVVESRRTTVGVDLHNHKLDSGTECKIYDVAGQITYYGLHQFFLTERAVYVLVWDATKFEGLNEEDLDKAVEDNILEWISLLHMRTPLCAVLLVASHYDMLNGTPEVKKQLLATVEQRFLALHERWKSRRNSHASSTDGRLKISPGVLPVGCRLESECKEVDYAAEDGLQAIDDELSEQKSVVCRVPPSWMVARQVLEKLGKSHVDEDGTVRCRQPWELRADIHKAFREVVEADRRSSDGRHHVWTSRLKPKSVYDSMEGAIEMRAFSGTLISHDIYVVLDVMWLAGVLKPILDHRAETENDLGQEVFADRVLLSHDLLSGREDLVRKGILWRFFARFLWNLDGQEDVKQEALQTILVEIGVAIPLPLSPPTLGESGSGDTAMESKEEADLETRDRTARSDDSEDLLVIMRLPLESDAAIRTHLDQARRLSLLPQGTGSNDNFAPEKSRRMLKAVFKFDHGGAPHGLPERVIAMCHKIGDLSGRARWRLGGLFTLRDHLIRGDGDEKVDDRNSFILEYDKKSREFTIEALGQRQQDFEAMRYVISAVFHIARDFPGVGWTGWLECGMAHEQKMYHLATSHEKEIRTPGSWIVPLVRRSPTANGIWQHNLCPDDIGIRSCALHPRLFGTVLDVKQPYPPPVRTPPSLASEETQIPRPTGTLVDDPIHREGFGLIVMIVVTVLTIAGGACLGVGLENGNAALWGVGVVLVVLLMVLVPIVAWYYRMCCCWFSKRNRTEEGS